MNIITLMLQDMYHFIPERIARRLKMTDGKSTSSLAYQSFFLLFTTALLAVPLAFFTVFLITKEPTVVIVRDGVVIHCPLKPQTENDLCSPTVYAEVPYSESLPCKLPYFGAD
jgi:hypothetical protein